MWITWAEVSCPDAVIDSRAAIASESAFACATVTPGLGRAIAANLWAQPIGDLLFDVPLLSSATSGQRRSSRARAGSASHGRRTI